MSSFGSLLRLFGDSRCIHKGRALHAKMIVSSGHCLDIVTNNHLVVMYVKFKRMGDAHNVFDKMPDRSHVSWSTLISGYIQVGKAGEGLNCFRLVVFNGFEPNDYVYVSALSASASLKDARAGKEIHGRIYRSFAEIGGRVGNSLVNMYGKCSLLKSARFVFDKILEPDIVSWTSLISCYCQFGENLDGVKIFLRSRRQGVLVTEFSCASVIGASAALEDLKLGMQVHSLVLKCGIEFDKFVGTGLINFYAKCGELDLASQAFFETEGMQQNLSAWTALIGGYAQRGKGEKAIYLFQKLHSSGFKPDERTFSSVLAAFAGTKNIQGGIQIQSVTIKTGLGLFTVVGNAVLDLYSKCGFIGESYKCFEEIDEVDVVSWNALIAGYIGAGHYTAAVKHVKDMIFEGYRPSFYTCSSILTICSNVPAIEWGKQTHCHILKPGYDSNIVVGSALVDMYAKCGRFSDARKVFDNLATKNLVTWNSMLVGYAQHGFGKEALEIYSMMLRNRIRPNDITFIGVLSACGHVGLVEDGWRLFNSMIIDHNISPTEDHLASLVNLFARNGQTKRAYEIIKTSSVEPTKVVWRCLLSGCRINKDVLLGKYAAEKILSTDPNDSSAHIMLSNIYAEAKMWDELASMRKIMKEKALKKDTGYSWIELKNNMVAFSSSNYMKYEEIDLSGVFIGLTSQLLDAGYVPDALFSLYSEE